MGDIEQVEAAKPKRKPKPGAATRQYSVLSRSMERASIRRKGVVTIPQTIRQQLDLEEGDEVIVTVVDGAIMLRPAAIIPRDQAWFWTPEWQAGEAKADAEIARGEGTFYGSDEEFLASLDSTG